MDYPDQYTTFHLGVPPELWDSWKDTVPRSENLSERIETLIEQDLNATAAGGYTEMEERTARLLASRIERRAQTALDAIEERDDIDSAKENLQKIGEIASQFDGG